MKEEQDYIGDIAQIRSMMERSSKFLSLSGLAGVLAGVYALSGAYIAHNVLEFKPDEINYSSVASANQPADLWDVMLLAVLVLFLAIGTAVFFSWQKADRRGEKIWNATSRRLLASMAVPLVAGGLLILLLLSKGFAGLMAPLTLLFYGLALYNAGKFTYSEVRFMGLIQVGLGLLAAWFIEYSLLLWAVGFGLVHIAYGIYIHFRYER